MADLPQALAAAREATIKQPGVDSERADYLDRALRDLLAALDAQEPIYFARLPDGDFIRVKGGELKALGHEVVKCYLAPPDLVTQLDHARRRIGQLTIQLGEVMKAPPAQPVAIANFDEIMSYGGMPPAPQPQAEPVASGEVDEWFDGCEFLVTFDGETTHPMKLGVSWAEKDRGYIARNGFGHDQEERLREIDDLVAVRAEQATPPPALALPEALVEVRRRLLADRKKNDHFTADPIYTVQRETRIYGLDPDYAEHFAWIEDSEVCASDLSERLERRFNRGWTIPDRYRRVGYCTQWVFVDAYLSYDAAKERVEYESRKHSGNYRTYVESGCRNHEWKALQAWLLQPASTPQPQPQAADGPDLEIRNPYRPSESWHFKEAAPQPQASAEDLAVVDGVIQRHVEWHAPLGVTQAWQRILAALGVSNG